MKYLLLVVILLCAFLGFRGCGSGTKSPSQKKEVMEDVEHPSEGVEEIEKYGTHEGGALETALPRTQPAKAAPNISPKKEESVEEERGERLDIEETEPGTGSLRPEDEFNDTEEDLSDYDNVPMPEEDMEWQEYLQKKERDE